MLAVVAGVAVGVAAHPLYAVGIQGTMSNFDVFNETGTNVYGAEIELEGLHPSEVTKTYPAHFSSMTATEIIMGSGYGTRLIFTGYTFNPPDNFIIPRVGQTTNGHYAVNLQGCEHFGFSVAAQPKSTAFYWLNQNSQRVTAALSIPMPTWTYVPAAGAAPAMMQAVLAPVPPPPQVLYPDAVWVKTYVTELPGPADLMELISHDDQNPDPSHPSVAPQLPSEIEAEWELLPGDSPLAEPDIQLADASQAVVRRYEYYQYTGTYDEVHLPNYQYNGGPLPPDAPVGQFIAANMVAANLVQSGACCVTATGACTVTSQADCPAGAGATWTSGGSCVPNSCSDAQGACCTGTQCSISTQAACAGDFQGAGSACGAVENPTTCCPANFNAVGGVTVQDIFDFLAAYFTADVRADFNNSGAISVQDIFDYLAAYFVGC